MSAPKLIPVLVGPTASGKTAVAAALARLVPVEIVSADSRQIYRRLDAGTAKPDERERAAADYHGIDIVEPEERYSAGRFSREATRWIEGILGRGRLPLVVGGTGLYLKALFDGLFDEPELDPVSRERLAGFLGGLEASQLSAWARRLDRGFTGGGRQRALRALEVALLSGRPLSRWQAEPPREARPFLPWYARLVLPRQALWDRISRRTASMLEGGLLEEVRGLLDSGLEPDSPGLSGVGYRETVQCLAGLLGTEELAAAVNTATRRYAKRQDTWFRRQLHGQVSDFDAMLSPEALAHEVLAGYRAAVSDQDSGAGRA